MRLRRKPGAKEEVRNHPRVVTEAETMRGHWRNLFGNEHPIHLELGTGKGQFLSTVCSLQPGVNWIGVERIEEVLLQALRKADKAECENLRFLWMDVQELDQVFDEEEVDRIYLHFSDPWPKKRHTKRRLTNRCFLEIYRKILRPGGQLQLKTDNLPFFEFSLEELEHCGFSLLEMSRDLHNSAYAEGNIPTEYEQKFASRGMPIYYLLAARPD